MPAMWPSAEGPAAGVACDIAKGARQMRTGRLSPLRAGHWATRLPSIALWTKTGHVLRAGSEPSGPPPVPHPKDRSDRPAGGAGPRRTVPVVPAARVDGAADAPGHRPSSRALMGARAAPPGVPQCLACGAVPGAGRACRRRRSEWTNNLRIRRLGTTLSRLVWPGRNPAQWAVLYTLSSPKPQ